MQRWRQAEEGVTLASKITKADAIVCFAKQSADDIFALYNAIGHQENLVATCNGISCALVGVRDPVELHPNMPLEQFRSLSST